MQYSIPMTDDEIRALAAEYLKHPTIRATMEALCMTEEEYIQILRDMYPYPTYTSSYGT